MTVEDDEGERNGGGESEPTSLPMRIKQPRQQLTKGMEHMRKYVTVNDLPPPRVSSTVENAYPEEDAYGVPAIYEPIRQPSTPAKDEANNPQQRTDPFQFGTRYLAEGDDIFAHNAWDHVQVDAHYADFITQQTVFQREHQVSDFDKQRFNAQPEKWWDRFYGNNAANFFKDRKWLVQEFPVLGEVTTADRGKVCVLEVGAGAGNTAFPLLAMNRNPELRLHACDYSRKAVDVIRSQEAYTTQSSPTVLRADVWDVVSASSPPGLEAESVDLVLLIFIFSALAPAQWDQAVRNVWTLLKPGGEVLFRDYGRGDLAQVRFKKGRYLEENFYVRGDGTRVYFFAEEELRGIWSGISSAISYDALQSEDEAGKQDSNEDEGEKVTQGAERTMVTRPSFEIVDLAVDRRMLVNRQRKIKMYRCWMQARFRKPAMQHHPATG